MKSLLISKEITQESQGIQAFEIYRRLSYLRRNWHGGSVFLPHEVIDEALAFCARNTIVHAEMNGKENYICCQPCLKAHVMKKARQMRTSKHLIMLFESLFPCQTGHEGYYMDQEKLQEV